MKFTKRIEEHVGTASAKFYKTTLFRSDAMLIGLNCLEPGQEQKPHDHMHQDKFYYVIDGSGSFRLGEDRVVASTGEVVWAPAGVVHGVINESDGRLTLLVGIAPSP